MTSLSIQQLMADSGVGFGTSGARGLVTQMTAEVCAAYSMAFAQSQHLQTGQTVALGMDLRPSSPAIVQACIAGLQQAGCQVVFCGVLPTPALALYALQQGVPAIMVTGSHIPFDRNGIKFYRADGEITKADEAAIAASSVTLPDLSQLPLLPPVETGALQAYRRRYSASFSADLLRGWRIGVYEHSSAARDVLREILQDLGAEVLSLERTDTFVPIDTEAVSAEDRQRGLNWAKQYSLDALVSTDGDGDRPLLGDENGQWLRGDLVGLLSARYLKADCVVTPVSCNTAIESSGYFTRVLRTRIGSPYVIEGMQHAQQSGARAIAGFEANGGFLAGPGLQLGSTTLAALPTRDSVLPVLALLAMARQSGVRLSALAHDLPKRYTASDRIQNFAASDSQRWLETLQSAPDAYLRLWGDELGTVSQQDITDGLRLTFSSGTIVHLRPSGNAPELRCYVEADSEADAQHWVEQTLQRIRQA